MSTRYLALGALIAAMATLGVGCEKEGPAEETGAAMDKAMENSADQMENAADKMEQSAQEIEKAAEEAKDSMEEPMSPPDAAPANPTAPQ